MTTSRNLSRRPLGCYSGTPGAPLPSAVSLCLGYALAALFALASVSALAFEEELEAHLQAGNTDQGYRWLLEVEPEYRSNPRYYDWRSRLAMEVGDYRGAAESLKMLIAMRPEHMGARLDLVLALQLDGRSFEARQALVNLNRLLRDVDELPELAERQLAELNALLLRDGPPAKEWSGRVEASLGYDGNANRGSEKDIIVINLGGVPVGLRLAPEDLKTGDEFAQARVHLEYGEKGNSCHLHGCGTWLAGAMSRQYNSLGRYDQRHLYVGYQHTFAGEERRELSLLASNIAAVDPELDDVRGIDRYDDQNSLSAEYRQRVPGTRYATVALSAEAIEEADRDLPVSSRAGIEFHGLVRWPWSRSFRAENERLLWSAAISYHHRPEYRPGDTERFRASLGYPLDLTDDMGLMVKASFQLRRDRDSYSPFFGDEHREDREWLFGAEFHYRLAPSWALTSSAWYERTDSTIPLFDVTRPQFRLGLGYHF